VKLLEMIFTNISTLLSFSFSFSFSLDELDLSSFFTTRNKDCDGYCLMKREKKTHSTR